MPDCPNCARMDEEVRFLRDLVRDLTDQQEQLRDTMKHRAEAASAVLETVRQYEEEMERLEAVCMFYERVVYPALGSGEPPPLKPLLLEGSLPPNAVTGHRFLSLVDRDPGDETKLS